MGDDPLQTFILNYFYPSLSHKIKIKMNEAPRSHAVEALITCFFLCLTFLHGDFPIFLISLTFCRVTINH